MTNQANLGKSILVVGGAGYIGSHVCKLLVKQGFEVTILDNLSTGHRAAAKYGDFIEGQAGDLKLVQKILKQKKIHTVMHFAAKALVGESVEKPMLYYGANITETINLLTAMINCDVKNFVFSSTCATYGVPETTPIHERVPQNPVNPYGRSKLAAEHMLRDSFSAYGISSVVLRYFNAAGACPEGELGEDHEPETHLIPRALKAVLKVNPALTVFGDDYPTKDGSCIRDYVHVNDLGNAHILAMKKLWEQPAFLDYNLGSEHGYSVFEIIDTIKKVTGHGVPFSVGPRRMGDPPVLIADSAKAARELGWKPTYSLEQIIQTAHQWLEKNRNGYK